MRYIKPFFAFWYDFLIGDDWGIAVGVVAVLLLTALFAHRVDATLSGAVLLLGVLGTGGVALYRAGRQS
ncbi:MAG TPA: hypothetical protein VIO16_04210 [Dehalococcoidia bacterium]